MLHEPIFSPKDFERQKAEIEILMSRIPNLESRREIVEQWQDAIEYERLQNKKEEDIQGEFLHKFFGEILGYQYGTHLEEENLRLEASTLYDFTKPDGALGFFRNDEPQASQVRAVIELKRYGINLDKPQNRVDFKGTPVEQAFSYASKMGKKCDWVIVSDFAEIRLYRYPNPNKYEKFHILSLLDGNNFQHFLFLLAKNQLFRKDDDENNVSSQAIIPRLYKGRMDFLEDITNQFYARYKLLREVLFTHIRQLNAKYEPAPLFTATQKILDRLIFMRFVSEIGLTEQNILKNVYQYNLQYLYDNTEEVAWVNIRALFSSFDKGYKANIPPFNGGLFAPDLLINKLIIKENYVKDWIKFLLDYDFQYDLKVDILGHIFEQSITDIQKLQARNFEPEIEEKANGKANGGLPPNRKQFGVFYTPQYVTQYIVKQTIGDYLEEKKTEIIASLGVPEITEITDDFQAWQVEKPSLTIEEVAEIHLQFWQKYKQCLESITVLDPACGSGAFLNAVFDFLYEKNVLAQAEINKLQAPKTPEEPQIKKKKVRKQDLFAQAQREEAQQLVSEELEYLIKRDILLNNVYGVDLNEESTEITKLSLWLKVANKRKPLPSLTDNIKLGNSLIDSPEFSPRAFNWQKEFPHIFKKGGFDVVVGNPPYVSANNMSYEERQYFNQSANYQTLSGKWDLYIAFIEKGINLIKNGGHLSFIVPFGLLNQPFATKIRKLILNDFSLLSIADLHTVRVFAEATVPTCIPHIIKKKQVRQNVAIFKCENQEFTLSHHIETIKYQQNDMLMFRTEKLDISFDLLAKIKTKGVELGKLFYVSTGAEIHGKEERIEGNKLISGHSKFDVLHKDNKKGYKVYIEGSAIPKSKKLGRYCLPKIDYYLDYDGFINNMRSPKFKNLFESPKIIIRRSAGLLGILATYDESKLYTSEKCILIINKSNVPDSHKKFKEVKDLSLKFLLGVMNSKLMNFYYQSVYSGFIDVYPNYLKLLPIATQNTKLQNRLVKKVDEILILHQKLSLIGYSKELEDKIQKIDDDIDSLVYQIYDITDKAEIALIENAK
jgi:hypothetical protein